LVVIVPLSTQQGTNTYDAWLDYNEDGIIDVNDLQPLGGAYGTTGDPTKNVNVTNWPDMLVQKDLFPKNLILRGACQGVFWPTLLIDETTAPCPLLKSGYDSRGKTISNTLDVVYNQTFVYIDPAAHSFQILGIPFATMTFNVTNSPASEFMLTFWIALGTINMAGEWSMISSLGSDGTSHSGVNQDVQRTSLMITPDVTLNVMVAPLERLAIRVVVWGQTAPEAETWLTLDVLCGTDTDYFVVNIPIVENP